MNAPWVKSSFSFANGNCVEVAELPGDSVGIRDSRDPGGPVLSFTRAEWAASPRRAARGAELVDPPDGLVDGIAAGDLDVVDDGAVPEPDQRVQREAICGSWVAMMTVISLSRRSLVSRSRIAGGGLRVQVAGGLVGQQQVRGVDQGAGDGDPLLFAAGHP